MELLYIWINNNPIDTLQHEFCFTPEYDIYFNVKKKELVINKKDILNIFKKDNILNISGIIGENGTGKTTLLNQLGKLPNIADENQIIADFITVFLNDEDIVIENTTTMDIYFDGNVLPSLETHCVSKKNNSNHKMTKVYLSNSDNFDRFFFNELDEYDYINLTTKAMDVFGKDFFNLKGTINNHVQNYENEKFKILQSIFPNFVENRFQSLIDIEFLEYARKLDKFFIGKEIKNIKFRIDKINNTINKDIEDLNYFKWEYHGEDISEFESNFSKINIKREIKNDIVSYLIINLAGELIYCYSDFTENIVYCENDKILYEKCMECIEKINGKNKQYFKSAIEEIEKIKEIKYEKVKNNYIVEIDSFWKIIKEFIYGGNSFILKYINI